MELSRGLSVTSGQKMTRAVNLSSGEAEFQFVEEHKDSAGAPLRIPGAFVIAVPVFDKGDRFQLGVRLRYRVSQGTVAWFFEVYRAAETADLAFEEAVAEVEGDTGLPVFLGKPEQ
jgi:hypothetical protein